MSSNMVLVSEKKIDNLAKQNEELKQKIEHLEKVNNQNTNKILKVIILNKYFVYNISLYNNILLFLSTNSKSNSKYFYLNIKIYINNISKWNLI